MVYRIKRVAFIVVALAMPVAAQVTNDNDKDLKRINVEEHLGDTIPLDLTFTNQDGQPVVLSQFFKSGRPVVLVLGYFRCPMLCNLVFNGVAEGINPLSLEPGKDFQIVTVSINPKETPELAAAKKANYLKSVGRPIDPAGWQFCVGQEDQIEKLAAAVGFKYFYIPDKDQYAHPAVIFLLTPDGVISRYLYGVQFKSSDLKLGLLEASQGKLGNTVDRIILYCFHYDPNAKGYVVVAGNVMKVGGLITMVVLGLLLTLLWFGERRRRRRRQAAAVEQSSKAEVT